MRKYNKSFFFFFDQKNTTSLFLKNRGDVNMRGNNKAMPKKDLIFKNNSMKLLKQATL